MNEERKQRLMAKYKKPPSKPDPSKKKPEHHSIAKGAKKTTK